MVTGALEGLTKFFEGNNGGEFTKAVFIALTAILTISRTINGVKKALGMETDKQAMAELKILEAKKREAEMEYQRLQALKENPDKERIAELEKAVKLEEEELKNIDEQIKKQEELLEKEKAAKLAEMNEENAAA
jgi:hypothetical protein